MSSLFEIRARRFAIQQAKARREQKPNEDDEHDEKMATTSCASSIATSASFSTPNVATKRQLEQSNEQTGEDQSQSQPPTKKQKQSTEERDNNINTDDHPTSAAAYAAITAATSSSSTPTASSLSLSSLLNYRSVRTRVSDEGSSALSSLFSTPTLKEQIASRPYQQLWLDSTGRQIGVHEFCAVRFRRDCEASRQKQRFEAAIKLGLSDPHDTRDPSYPPLIECTKVHLVEMIRHGITIRAYGECDYLNACNNHHCQRIHFGIDPHDKQKQEKLIRPVADTATTLLLSTALVPSSANSAAIDADNQLPSSTTATSSSSTLSSRPPAEWICCDIRRIDVSVLGDFGLLMMDPPWRINMNLPYETMGDEEMLNLNIAPLQENGICCVWVVTRAIHLGRRCLQRWGYRDAGELLWVKIDQLHRLKRTGRTGHWLNHTKEHCLIGVKGRIPAINCNLDCDVIVSQTRETSRKPDEIYSILERLAPGQRALEIFGRQHNTRPGWLTLGNQLDGINVTDGRMKERIKARYGEKALQGRELGV